MKRHLIIAMLFVSSFIIATAFAQAAGPKNVENGSLATNAPLVAKTPLVTNVSVLVWAKAPQGIDWFSGIAFALIGFVGALVTIYFIIGGAMPGTAGQVEIDYDAGLLKLYEEKLKDLHLSSKPEENAKAKELEPTVDHLRNSLYRERWRQFIFAASLYAIIGALLAMFLAQDVLQAGVIGAGWTGYIGALGLKQDAEERGSRKDDTNDALMKRTKENEQLIEKIAALSHDDSKVDKKGELANLIKEWKDTKTTSTKSIENLENEVKIVRTL